MAHATGRERSSATPTEGQTPESSLADVIARLRRAMRRAARADEPAATLAVAQLELLSCLAENPGSRPGTLAKILRLAPNSVTTLANGLEAKGLLARTASTGDRRAVTLELTDEGAAAVAGWQLSNTAIVRAALSALAADQREALLAALPALHEFTAAIDALGNEAHGAR